MKKRLLCTVLSLLLLFLTPVCFAEDAAGLWDEEWVPAVAVQGGTVDVPAPNVVLMERSTGTILYEKAADERLYPASVTKVMTLLLTMEAIERGELQFDQKISVSAYAMSMGGSTAFLHEGEEYTVDDMLKAVTIQSANDGAVVLAEAVSGTHSTFVGRMNERAAELGMTGTRFVNAHGLDDGLRDDEHYTTAKDVAIMSRALLGHKAIRNYSTVWMDSLRDGSFGLSNTNRLVRYYEGCTGLKTGTTARAGSCVAASAERDGMELIAVVMHAANSNDRYESARGLLDYGFANYGVMAVWPDQVPQPIPVILGKQASVQPILAYESYICFPKQKKASLERVLELTTDVEAPVALGQKLGEARVLCDGELLGSVPLVAAEAVERLSWWDIFLLLLGTLTAVQT